MAQQDPKIAERLAKLRAKMASVDTGNNKGFWSPPANDSVIRILPEIGRMEFFFQEVGQHFIPGEKNLSVICPNFTTSGQFDCPICELVSQLWKGDETDKELAKKLRHDRKFWMNIVVRSKEDQGGDTGDGPFIFTPGVTIFGSIQALVNNPTMGDITHELYGLDLIINKKGEKLNTEYKVFNRPTRSDIPLHTDVAKMDDILEKAVDLSWVMLSENPEEDKDLAGGHIVKLLPYDRMLDEYGIGPDMDVNKLANEPGRYETNQASGSQVRDALRAKRTAGREPEQEEEAFPVAEVQEDAVGAQLKALQARRQRS
jgi:hypothetical protein